MQRNIATATTFALVAFVGNAAAAGDIGNAPLEGTAWAQTPLGRFACQQGAKTGYRQVLTLADRTLYEQSKDQPTVLETGLLADGILNENVGCPTFVANQKGYLLVVRDPQPPQFGAQEYLIINFNTSPYRFVSLGTGMRPLDEKIPDDKRLRWTPTGIEISFYGYRTSDECCTTGTKKPKRLKAYYDFSSGTVRHE